MKKMLAALCVVAVAASACGGRADTSGPTQHSSAASASSATEQASATITIAKMGFGDPLTVAPGAVIAIKNDDSVEHSVTSTTKDAFDTHVDGGTQKTMTAPAQPGEYAFYCVYHPSMKGTLIVK